MQYWPVYVFLMSFCGFASGENEWHKGPMMFGYMGLSTLCLYLMMRTRILQQRAIEQDQAIAQRTEMLQHKSQDMDALKQRNKNLLTNTCEAFRTPLTLLLAPVENLLSNEADKRKKAQITSIKHNSQQLLRIVEQMQEVSQTDDPQATMAAQDCPEKAKLGIVDNELNAVDQQFVERFEAIVAANFHLTGFNRSQAASQMAISERQLNRKLSTLTDNNFSGYLRIYRLRQAICLMGQGLQVSQIGDRVGFSSTTYFSSCFKTEFGKTVKQYEQQLASTVAA